MNLRLDAPMARAALDRPAACPMCPPASPERSAPGGSGASPDEAAWRVALVGAPNVGKSTLFHRLTGRYVTVSNYPRTSVEVTYGVGRLDGHVARVVDTPGMYSLAPTTEEERVSRRLVLEEGVDALVHVVEARSVARSLPLTLDLMELGKPLVLALNMVDELGPLGLELRPERLGRALGLDALPIVAVTGEGVDGLERAILEAIRAGRAPTPVRRRPDLEAAVEAVSGALSASYAMPRRAVASLLLQADRDTRALVEAAEADGGRGVGEALGRLAAGMRDGTAYRSAVERHEVARALAEEVLEVTGERRARVAEKLGRWLARPLPGIPVLLVVLWLGLYEFVGQFGAGTLVDGLERGVFLNWLNPLLEGLFRGIPWPWLRGLWVGDYGLLTLGLRYAIAIILPIVATFFLFFSVLEDSGYLPRLALLVDRLFKRLGLNGRAVIPIVLGFACDTMATMVARTLETRRERILATVLLALAIPCSAQLGVILAILSGQPLALGLWVAVLAGTFILIGGVGARVLPGRSAAFHMELPPLRVPRASNVLRKTATRLHWYLLEVIPLFMLASVLLWAGQVTGLLGRILDLLHPAVAALGLPPQTASVFLLGFFRRDYGAAGLYELQRTGALDLVGLVVAAVTLTLFVPCVAQFLMMWKERGPKIASGIFAFAVTFAFGVGFGLNLLLRGIGL
jgi:ferrous iron transport protein B